MYAQLRAIFEIWFKLRRTVTSTTISSVLAARGSVKIVEQNVQMYAELTVAKPK